MQHTSPLFNSYGKLTNRLYSLGFLPFKWNQENQVLMMETGRTKRDKLVTTAKFLVLVSHVIFLIFRFFSRTIGIEMPLLMKLLAAFRASVYPTLTISFGILFWTPWAIPGIINALLYAKSQESGSGVSSKNIGLRFMMKAMPPWCLYTSMTFALPVLWNPGDARFLTSLAGDPVQVNFCVKFLVGLYHMYCTCFVLAMTVFTASTATILGNTVVRMTDALRCKVAAKTYSAAFVMNNFKRLHSNLAVLFQQFNNTFGFWSLYTVTFSVVCIVVNLSLVTVYHSMRALAVSVMVMAILYIFKKLGQVYESSAELHRACICLTHNNWIFAKQLKALRPLRVNIGSFFYADRSILLTCASIILQSIGSLVIASR